MKPFLRITGGKARGRRLFSPAGRWIRPSSSRVRIAIFNIIRPRVEGARVLDLFAGTGSLGLDALSRGAAFCLFIEKRAEAMEALRRNVKKLGFEADCRKIPGDAFRGQIYAGQVGAPFDLVFFDPPHGYWETKKDRLLRLLESFASSDAIRPDAIWVIGHPHDAPEPDELAFLGELDHRSYSDAHITIANKGPITLG
ncbi:MAG: 16S rRNA (guanine(966)-N(2))-methyltransferase RsmD [Planctomycetota bacterium]|nr:16S rRNA (guanine(966)-N(2))-methyltransferase RsmD [Planctomycetota bacterium]